jgi:predicted dehydrogenase
MSGFAAVVLKMLCDEEDHPEARTTLAGVYAPDATDHAEALADLAGEGVVAHGSHDALLASDIDAVWLPVPIHLHRALAERAIAAGKVVLLEKPVAGCIDEHDALARFAGDHGGRVLVGFQDILGQAGRRRGATVAGAPDDRKL